ncbi:hypothetical protein L21SP3_01013 [Sedimentisphaera cyanobacteriorum]|uniref:Uncharacterized protein n=1 Tax=Sedimentisphaera cyanobacteriorum TaxID=1940790 RepID=A0A1Q2HP24_9BACT|nr:hypothetical protein [Sedimentisphaera cyanobacteriorum]AQQ09212.1 hypothetical protein L21SP3_01013 [Sedimentisphaera cyanobacteriorum]
MANVNIIGTTGDSINMLISRRTYPQEQDKWDGNWLNTQIKIKVGSFSGKTDALLRSDEFEQLSKAIEQFLYKKVESVTFSPMEPWICFRATKNRKQNIEFAGEVTDRLGTGNILKFQLELSLPDLKKILEEINAVLHDFPVKQ